MSVHQLKDGRWIVQYRSEDGYKREYFGRGLKAEVKARDRNQDLAPRPYVRRTEETISPRFEELARDYVEGKRGWMESSSLQNLVYKLKGVILPELGNIQAVRLNHHRITQYVNKRLKAGVKRTTVHREISDVQAILNWSVEQRYIKHNPLAGYKKPKRDDEIIQPPTAREMTALFNYAAPHLIRALAITYYSGLRPGQVELSGLKWTDMDWDQETILIRSAKKGGPPFRIVPIHPDLMKLLRRWQKEDKPWKGEIIRYREKPVKFLKKTFATAKRRAGITRRLPLYAFRHAFATGVLTAGGDPKSASEVLGHSRPDTTTRIYHHTNLELKRKTVEKLPSLKIPRKTMKIKK